jgi:hypothetical protein
VANQVLAEVEKGVRPGGEVAAEIALESPTDEKTA